MASTPATNAIGVELQAAGENLNTWGDPKLNNALQILVNLAHGWKAWTINGDYTVSETNYSTTNDTENAVIKLAAGTVTASFNVTLPGRAKRLVFWNATAYSATLKLAATSGFTLPAGSIAIVATDGVTDVYNLSPNYGGVSNPSNAQDIPNKAGVAALINAASTNINGAFYTRYTFLAAGGETSISGVDIYGNTLAYTPGLCTVTLNGAALAPADYTASTGTSISGMSALTAADVLEVIAWASFSVANTYTQAQVDALISAAGNAYLFVSSTAIAGGTSVDVTGLVAGYDYIVQFRDIKPASDNVALEARFSQGGAFLSGATDYNDTAGAASSITIAGNWGNDVGESGSFDLVFPSPGGSGFTHRAWFQGGRASNTGSEGSISGVGRLSLNTTACDGVQVFFIGSNVVAQGTVNVWRRKLS